MSPVADRNLLRVIVALIGILITALALLWMSPAEAKRHYAFLPSPGHWNADHTQYENKRILYVDGVSYCKYETDAERDSCDYWQAITWRKGKIDRNEAIVIGLQAAPAAWDVVSTVSKLRDGCSEWGARQIIGTHPSRNLLIAYQGLFLAPTIIVSARTPLAKSSAPILFPWAAWRGGGSFRAARHNLSVACVR